MIGEIDGLADPSFHFLRGGQIIWLILTLCLYKYIFSLIAMDNLLVSGHWWEHVPSVPTKDYAYAYKVITLGCRRQFAVHYRCLFASIMNSKFP